MFCAHILLEIERGYNNCTILYIYHFICLFTFHLVYLKYYSINHVTKCLALIHDIFKINYKHKLND
jgi:hypothetical protein